METIALVILLLFKGVVTDEPVSVYEGDSVTLHTDTKLQRDDKTEWRFGDGQDLIARINKVANSHRIYDDVLDGRFRGKLKMNDQTGDLTITNITTEHTGVYTLYISSETIMIKRFNVYVCGDKLKTEMKGDSFIQHNNVIKNPGDEKIRWRIQYNNSPVAEIIRNGKETNDTVHDERFRDRLQVDDQTGDLSIRDITPEDFGSYEVNITVGSHTHTIHRSFSVKDDDQSSSKSPGVIAGVFVVLLVLAVAVFLYRRRSRTHGKRVSTEDPDGGL